MTESGRRVIYAAFEKGVSGEQDPLLLFEIADSAVGVTRSGYDLEVEDRNINRKRRSFPHLFRLDLYSFCHSQREYWSFHHNLLRPHVVAVDEAQHINARGHPAGRDAPHVYSV